jgi:hypothetical protein
MPRSYAAVHKHLARTYGSAKLHICPCGQQAAQWSYDGSSDHEVTGTSKARNRRGGYYLANVTYSTEIEDYTARCRACHVALDWTPERRANQSILVKLQPVRERRVTVGKVVFLHLMGLDVRETANVLDCSPVRVYEVIREAKA